MTPPNTITLHERPDGGLILEYGYDTVPYLYRLVNDAVSLDDLEALRAAGLGHLADDAPFVVCSSCERKSWALHAAGQYCGMPQPDGFRCSGILNFPQKPGLVNENEYSALYLRRVQKPVEAENDEHDLDDAEGR